MPNEGYGAKRVVVTLDDGTEYAGVRVAWGKEVVAVLGHDEIPFDVTRIADVRRDPYQESDATSI